jgi:hypothetical protein
MNFREGGLHPQLGLEDVHYLFERVVQEMSGLDPARQQIEKCRDSPCCHVLLEMVRFAQDAASSWIQRNHLFPRAGCGELGL